jgi:hypothetical protein
MGRTGPELSDEQLDLVRGGGRLQRRRLRLLNELLSRIGFNFLRVCGSKAGYLRTLSLARSRLVSSWARASRAVCAFIERVDFRREPCDTHCRITK